MSRPARRFCSTPNCPNLTDGGRCPACRRKADRLRPGATARGYDAVWAAYSRAWLARHRYCGERTDFYRYAEHSRCVQLGLWTRATVTDHIVPLSAGGAHCDPMNSQSLCANCNRRKAIAHEGALAPPSP
jgi:5-methylcytosine-specific restriction protein A